MSPYPEANPAGFDVSGLAAPPPRYMSPPPVVVELHVSEVVQSSDEFRRRITPPDVASLSDQRMMSPPFVLMV